MNKILNNKKIIFEISSSIAACKSYDIINFLTKNRVNIYFLFKKNIMN